MRRGKTYDHDEIRRLRAAGLSISDVQQRLGCSTGLISMVARMEPTADNVAVFRTLHLQKRSTRDLRSLLHFHRSLTESIAGELFRRGGVE